MSDRFWYELGTFFVLVLIFELWERLRPARDVNRFAALKIDLLSFSLAILLNRLCGQFWGSIARAITPRFLVPSVVAVQALPGAIKIVMAIVMADFIIYWIHRGQHRFDILWRTHAWHHSIKQMY